MANTGWTDNYETDYILDVVRVRKNLSLLPWVWRRLENWTLHKPWHPLSEYLGVLPQLSINPERMKVTGTLGVYEETHPIPIDRVSFLTGFGVALYASAHNPYASVSR